MKLATAIEGQSGRRHFLRSAITTGAFLLGSAGLRPAILSQRKSARRFFPVRISRDRLIRTLVGLRPYRSEGFVLRADRLGDKIVVHNYGHGGAGVTLSWGVATLAVEHIAIIESQNVAVLGCGVIGLSTARLLQQRGKTVTIYARDLPPNTTSNASGALWFPTSTHNPLKVSIQFVDQFRRACHISNRMFQTLVGNEYGVRWIETYDLQSDASLLERELPGGNHLYPETRLHNDSRRYFGFAAALQFSTMLIEPAIYLNALLRDYYTAGGKIVVRELQSLEEISNLPESAVFNCTGLGSKTLFNDEGLTPVRGQLEVLLPQAELDYCYLHSSCYMFPRRDGVILGGSFQHDNWSLEADPELTTRILESNAEVMKGLR